MGNCTKSKICFICGIAGHHMNVYPAWKKDHPVAAYVGSSSLGLGFYHLQIPDVESTQWLNLTSCGVVRVIAGEVSLAELELELSEIYCMVWPWQIWELEKGNFLVRFPHHKKVADIKNYPSFNLRKEGVRVEVLEWLGDMKPFGPLQEVWVQMNGIPPRVFAQIASSFGLLVEVDWSILFKTFYETIRIKVAVKDYTKIPKKRLFEMNRNLHVVEFTVETEDKRSGPKDNGSNDDGGDGRDDGKGGLDEEADGLYDTDTEKEPTHDIAASNNPSTKTPYHKPSSNSGYKTVTNGMMIDQWDQDQQLKECMSDINPELLTTSEIVDVDCQSGTDAAMRSEILITNDCSVIEKLELYATNKMTGRDTAIMIAWLKTL